MSTPFVIEDEEVSVEPEQPRSSSNRSKPEDDEAGKKRFHVILCLLIFTLGLVVVAIVLPFVIDNDDDDDITPKVVTTAAPTNAPTPEFPTMKPSLAPTSTDQTPTLAPTTLRLGNFIRVYLIPAFGEEVFQDLDGPQSKAAEFLADHDGYVSELQTIGQLADRYGAAVLYYSTGGEDWTSCSRTDASCGARAWLTGGVCEWYAISCNEAGRIRSVAFNATGGNGLIGTIPVELWLFNELEELIIANDMVSGSLPIDFGVNATNVTKLVLQDLELEGTIPNAYMSNSPVEEFVVSGNKLTGSVPTKVGNTDTMTVMDVSGNRLSRSIPDLSMYANINTLSLADNDLQSSIPEKLYEMTNLQRLHLNGNSLLEGKLSPSIRSMVNLQQFLAGGTNLAGLLPDELFTLTSLEELDLSGSSLEGPLSSSFALLSENLGRLYLDGNAFTGTVPKAFGLLNNLDVLTLHGNQLKGEVPSEVCSLTNGTDSLQVLTVDCEVSCSCCADCF